MTNLPILNLEKYDKLIRLLLKAELLKAIVKLSRHALRIQTRRNCMT